MEFLSKETFDKVFKGVSDKVIVYRAASNLASGLYSLPVTNDAQEDLAIEKIISDVESTEYETRTEIENIVARRISDVLDYPKREIDNFLSNKEFLDFIFEFRTGFKKNTLAFELENNFESIPKRSPAETQQLFLNSFYGDKNKLVDIINKYSLTLT